MTTILSGLGGRIAGPVLGVCALAFACGFAWQSGRIEGWPLIGGGLKARIAQMQQQLAARDLADARAQAAALAARQAVAEAANGEARAHALADQAVQSQIRTVIQKVPVYVSIQSDTACVIPWGAVRLLDAAASGADPDAVDAALAPGQPDDAASDVKLSEAVALLAANLGIARQNASQLMHLQKAARP